MRRAAVLLPAIVSALWFPVIAAAAAAAAFDAAAAFGARQDVTGLTLSPDGNNVAFIVPVDRTGTSVRTLALATGAKPKVALYASGKPDRIQQCNWVSNDRLVCQIFWIGPHPDLLPFWRVVAVNADGSNLKYLGKPKGFYRLGIEFGGDEVGRVDVQFLSGEPPKAQYDGASVGYTADKAAFGTSRIRRWFGQDWTAY